MTLSATIARGWWSSYCRRRFLRKKWRRHGAPTFFISGHFTGSLISVAVCHSTPRNIPIVPYPLTFFTYFLEKILYLSPTPLPCLCLATFINFPTKYSDAFAMLDGIWMWREALHLRGMVAELSCVVRVRLNDIDVKGTVQIECTISHRNQP